MDGERKIMSGERGILSFNKFYNSHLKGKKSFSLLFGNGFLLSHPDKTVRDAYKLSRKDYQTIIKALAKEIKKINQNTLCPETILSYMQVAYGAKIFIRYIDKQQKLPEQNIKRATKFIENFKSIYTLNYDVLSYVTRFEVGRNNINTTDGFNGKSHLSLAEIEANIKNNNSIPFYYLHDAFFIMK